MLHPLLQILTEAVGANAYIGPKGSTNSPEIIVKPVPPARAEQSPAPTGRVPQPFGFGVSSIVLQAVRTLAAMGAAIWLPEPPCSAKTTKASG